MQIYSVSPAQNPLEVRVEKARLLARGMMPPFQGFVGLGYELADLDDWATTRVALTGLFLLIHVGWIGQIPG